MHVYVKLIPLQWNNETKIFSDLVRVCILSIVILLLTFLGSGGFTAILNVLGIVSIMTLPLHPYSPIHWMLGASECFLLLLWNSCNICIEYKPLFPFFTFLLWADYNLADNCTYIYDTLQSSTWKSSSPLTLVTLTCGQMGDIWSYSCLGYCN